MIAPKIPRTFPPHSVTLCSMEFERERVSRAARALADHNILIGTSSWKYEGWFNQLYDPARYQYRGKLAKSRFESSCLEEYAETFKTVCVDAGFYRFPSEKYIDGLAGQVPQDFRLSFKVTEEITLKHFPNHPRHGTRAGKENPHFLSADLFTRAFLRPLEPHREKIGILMFEFGHFYQRDFAQGREFVAALGQFLGAIPRDWQYGVEIRNPSLLQPEYFEMLHGHGVAHVFNSWTGMPPVSEQMALSGSFTTDHFAARFLLKPGRKYAEAVEAFSPYSEIKQELPEARAAMKVLTDKSPKARSYLFVNNRLEGNALSTIASAIAAR